MASIIAVALLLGCICGLSLRLPAFGMVTAAALLLFGVAEFFSASSIGSFVVSLLVAFVTLQAGYVLGVLLQVLIAYSFSVLGAPRPKGDIVMRDHGPDGPSALR